MVRLGAVTASALDAGGSTTMAFDGKLLNRPSDPGGERAVADGLFVFYYGVQAPALSVQVALAERGRRGRGRIAELQSRPTVDRHCEPHRPGPGSAADETGLKEPGTYKLDWNGRTAQGAPEPEGRWRWVINAVDDQRSAVARRAGLLPQQHARLPAGQPVPRGRPPTRRVAAGLLPARASRSGRAQDRTASGATVRTISRRFRAGRASIRWNGRYGSGVRAFSGPYVASLRALNSFGPAQLERRFAVRRGR